VDLGYSQLYYGSDNYKYSFGDPQSMGSLQFSESDVSNVIKNTKFSRLPFLFHELKRYPYQTESYLHEFDIPELYESYLKAVSSSSGKRYPKIFDAIEKIPEDSESIHEAFLILENIDTWHLSVIENSEISNELRNEMVSSHHQFIYLLNRRFSPNFQKEFYLFNQDLELFYRGHYLGLWENKNLGLVINLEAVIETKEDFVLNVAKPIIDNAIDYGFPDKTKKGEIVVEGEKLESDFYQISIFNNGIEIPSTIIENIFEKGVTTREEKEGHGIALWHARNFVKSNGGIIDVISYQEETSLRFTFPCIEKSDYYYVQK